MHDQILGACPVLVPLLSAFGTCPESDWHTAIQHCLQEFLQQLAEQRSPCKLLMFVLRPQAQMQCLKRSKRLRVTDVLQDYLLPNTPGPGMQSSRN